MAAFEAFRSRLEADGQPEAAIEAFRRHYDHLSAGATGLISEASIDPIDALPDAEDFGTREQHAGQSALSQTVMIKLNGGLGTSMGLQGPKSLLPIRGELVFLDLIADQAVSAGCPLLLMNSFATRAPSLARLEAHPRLATLCPTLPFDFVQHRVPKVDRQTLQPAVAPDDARRHLEWCPPGHGDLFTALHTRGLLKRLLAAGRRYAFVSNADNLGASVDTALLGHMVLNDIPFMMEVADRTEADRKGGHLALRDGRLMLREAAQCAKVDLAQFRDPTRHRYFNTNNLWLDLEAVQKTLQAHHGSLPLPLIRNKKTLDPRDHGSRPVYQLESAMGAAIEIFEGAQAVRVSRARFAPVKTTSDLLLARSDVYCLDAQSRLVLSADVPRPPVVTLSPEYRMLQDLDRYFPFGSPSLAGCMRFAVEGPITFGDQIVVTGDTRIATPRGTPFTVPTGTHMSGMWTRSDLQRHRKDCK